MSTTEFIFRYREYTSTPGTWDETVFRLGDWPDPASLPVEDKIENHPEASRKWFSIQFVLSHEPTDPESDIRARAKKHARSVFEQYYPGAKLY